MSDPVQPPVQLIAPAPTTTSAAAPLPQIEPVFVAPAPAAPIPVNEKPVISQRQANWHVHVEGAKAEHQARETGTDVESSTTLLDAACDGVMIGNVQFPAVHASYLLMLPMIIDTCGKFPALNHDAGQLMAMSYALAKPESAWAILRGKSDLEFDQVVFDFAKPFNLDQLKQLNDWVTMEVARMNADAEEQKVGK